MVRKGGEYGNDVGGGNVIEVRYGANFRKFQWRTRDSQDEDDVWRVTVAGDDVAQNVRLYVNPEDTELLLRDGRKKCGLGTHSTFLAERSVLIVDNVRLRDVLILIPMGLLGTRRFDNRDGVEIYRVSKEDVWGSDVIGFEGRWHTSIFKYKEGERLQHKYRGDREKIFVWSGIDDEGERVLSAKNNPG